MLRKDLLLLVLLQLLRIKENTWHHHVLTMRPLLVLLRKAHDRSGIALRRKATLLLLHHRMALGKTTNIRSCGNATAMATAASFCVGR